MIESPSPSPADPAAVARIQPLAAPWREWRQYERIASTQRLAVERMTAGEDLRGVVLGAEVQTGGHGRQGRPWASGPGGLYVSAVLPVGETLDGRWIGWVPLIAALGTVQWVRDRWGIEARIKWPNDVLVDGRKLAGVLGELAHLRPADGRVRPERRMVVGMGMNWANGAQAAGRQGGFSAIALGDLVVGITSADRESFLVSWLAVLASRVAELVADPAAASVRMRAEAEPLLWRRAEPVRFENTEQGPIEGILLGLGETATARLALTGGRAVEVSCGWQVPEPFAEGEPAGAANGVTGI